MASENLTDRRVAAARAEAGQRLEIFDRSQRGLVLRVTGDGHKSWVVRYRTADGRQPRMKLGDYPAMSLADAREDAGDVLKAVKRGVDPALERKRSAAAAKSQPLKTFGDLAAAYFSACRSGEYHVRTRAKAESTIAAEEWLYGRVLREVLGRKMLEDIFSKELKDLLRDQSRGTPVQANRTYSLLSQIFNYAVAEERIEKSPIGTLSKPTAELGRDRVFDDHELRVLWSGIVAPSALAREECGKRRSVSVGRPVSIALLLTMLTLQRRAEISSMRRTELALDRGEWIIPKERTKNRREHVVPLGPHSIQLLREALELSERGRGPTPFVFPSPRSREKPIGAGALSHAFNDVLVGAGLVDGRLHDLRRSGATHLTGARGAQRRFIVSKVLNHGDADGASVTAVYDRHEYLEEKRRALLIWEHLLLDIVNGQKSAGNVVELKGFR